MQTFGRERIGDRGNQAAALLDLLLKDLFFVHGIPQTSGGSTTLSVAYRCPKLLSEGPLSQWTLMVRLVSTKLHRMATPPIRDAGPLAPASSADTWSEGRLHVGERPAYAPTLLRARWRDCSVIVSMPAPASRGTARSSPGKAGGRFKGLELQGEGVGQRFSPRSR